MASESGREQHLAVHFSSDMVEVIEFKVEQDIRPVLECNVPTVGDITTEQEWNRCYAALRIRMRCEERQMDRAHQKRAPWRASRLRKRLDDSDDESCLEVVLRRRILNRSERLQLPSPSVPCSSSTQTEEMAGREVSPKSNESLVGTRWKNIMTAARSAIGTPTFLCPCPPDQVSFEDSSPNQVSFEDSSPTTSERSWRARFSGESCIDADSTSKPPGRAQRSRMFQWTRSKRSRVHASFDPIACGS
eukprot:TRINITY_DN5987_c0_g1_i1.p1 TRINITY_DN5987_c0_g1~~TRINITY_DN5987_c0_g1_i1.p1  ORF type:complete len:247 (+),score=21.52 TRINITY_DN5987_c0_g1_i1:102-842(+)